MAAVRDHLSELADASVAVITFAAGQDLGAYRRALALPFPVLSDPDRAVYRRFGLGRAPVRAVYGLGTLRLYARLIRRGWRFRRATQDTRQLGGDFVLDGAGRLVWGFWPRSPDARPPVTDVADAVRGA